MGNLEFCLIVFMLILYVIKCETTSRIRSKLEKNECRRFITHFIKEFTRPHNINNLQWSYLMKVGKIKLAWNKSVSPSVVGQPLLVAVDGSVVCDESFAPEVESYEFDANEGVAVNVALRADNGTFKSEPVSLDFVVPTLVAPEAPTNLTYEVVDVVDVPDPEPEPEPAPESGTPPPVTT